LVRVLGVPIETPQSIVGRIVNDLGAVARLARSAPERLDRILELGEEMTAIARNVLEIAERLDARAEAALELGERLDARAEAALKLGERLDRRAGELIELGDKIQALGRRVDERGGEIVERANRVTETGAELIAVLPAFERAVEMATPLEGAIDRFGRLVDRLPGGPARRRAEQAAETAETARRQAEDAAATADGQ
jgi:hypothetical protein